MLSSLGLRTRRYANVLVGITGLFGLAINTCPQLLKPQRRRIFWLLFKRQLYNSGLRAASINTIIAVLLGVFVMSKAYSVIPNNMQFIDYYAQFFNIVVNREIGPLISGIILIARSASAVTAEVGQMQLYRQFDALSAVNMSPALVFLLPVFFAFPLSLLLMFFYFNLICVFTSYAVIELYHEGGITLMAFIRALLEQLTFTEVLVSMTKALVGGCLIGLASLFFGYNVQDRFTDVSRAISNSNTFQLFAFFVLNVGLSYLVYL
jgi:phospholipid/cholesterol/gamma-HCH transport system permease protein|tara:strand:- start:4180 stop:4971 length:792 start_codon:yes stop_codon:yes gene_type:complete